jgi:hypothetical protein
MSTADSSDTTDKLALLCEPDGVTSAPAPSAARSARMDAGVVAHDVAIVDTPADELATRRRGHVAAAGVFERARGRTRYAVAGLAAAFVVTSGLAVAGVLPGAAQREASSVVSHLGIDLPNPLEHPPSGSATEARGVLPRSPSAPTDPATPSIAPSDSVAPATGSEATPTTLPGSGLGTDSLSGVVPSVAVEPVTPPTVVLPVVGSEALPIPAATLP